MVDFDRKAVMKYFVVEAEEGFSSMEQLRLRFEHEPPDPESLHTIFRMAHSLKGNAASLDLSVFGEVAYPVEDLIQGIRDGYIVVKPGVIDFIATDS